MPVINSTEFRTTMDNFAPGSWRERSYRNVVDTEVPVLQWLLYQRRLRTLRKRGWTGGEIFVDDAEQA